MSTESAPPVDRSNLCTTDGTTYDPENPNGETKPGGQHERYVVLCETERAKGFVRPLRRAYIHKGERPNGPTRELTAEEHERYDGYVAYEAYPEGSSSLGRLWTKADLNSGCGTLTTMGLALSETYARDPKFYGSTFCCGCNKHLPVAEFVWEDGERVGS